MNRAWADKKTCWVVYEIIICFGIIFILLSLFGIYLILKSDQMYSNKSFVISHENIHFKTQPRALTLRIHVPWEFMSILPINCLGVFDHFEESSLKKFAKHSETQKIRTKHMTIFSLLHSHYGCQGFWVVSF